MTRNRKPKLHTQEVHNISKHSFEKHEWSGIRSEMEIRKLLQQYRQEFAVRVWSENDIRHFLSGYQTFFECFSLFVSRGTAKISSYQILGNID